ncbi:PREDICTED: leucine-rich repeat-containing protein 24-like [Papilio xuthus]|uniref:Leucine-rich repeat-containing protein 24-like n=1 Tax=Papilio xuthus TaxID=66420 RepID=A0AAJ6ZF65_PAPXU|nr:PREDICTED: leucine-rich repeat-containing protein 24-like [Papilio xuthus]
MKIQDLYKPLWLIVIFLNQSECDWLNCGHIEKCHCKWSSGKKTATCSSAGLTNIPRLSPDIQVLDLHDNALRELNRDTFTGIDLLNLQRLNLSDTKLRRIHNNAFRELIILIELDLSHNELHHLSPEIFDGIDRLRHLILHDNPLKEFYSEQFPILRHLKKLEISKCQLHKIHPLAFSNLRVLETIHAHQNLLSYVHPNTFNLPFLKTLTLSDNPWYCDCRLRNFHEWFLNANLGNEEVLCAGPKNFANISWQYIKENEFVCPPQATSNPTVLRAEVGADISFGCFASGDPKPNVSWYLGKKEIQNLTTDEIEIKVYKYDVIDNEFNTDMINKSSQWMNISISNITDKFSGEWICHANSFVGEASANFTLFLSTPRTATARSAPEFPKLILFIVSMLSMTLIGFIATCICWKTRRRSLSPSKSFTDQEKKLLDSSLAASCGRQSVDLSSSYGFEMLDRSTSIDSTDTQRCLDTVQITLETSGQFPSPPIEFTLPSSFANIFISVQLTDKSEGNSDFLCNERNVSHCRPCFFESSNDNTSKKFRTPSCSTLSFSENNATSRTMERNLKTSLSSFSTEFTAL